MTTAKNPNDDVAAKGQLVPPTARRGAQNAVARLTEEKVRQIRRLHAEGLVQREIAERIGVSRGAVSAVLTGRNWGHVT